MILSVYLGSNDKKTPDPQFLIGQFHSLMHKIPQSQKNSWQKSIDKIEKYLHESVRKKFHSYVFFTGKNTWEVLNFEFYLPPLLEITKIKYVLPLVKAYKKYKRYLVLLVDREKAKIFSINLGKIEERQEIFNGQVPQNVKAKKVDWGRDDKIFRHIEQHLHYHLKSIARALLEFSKDKNFHFIILGGRREMTAKMKKYLLYPLNKKIEGEFVADLDIPVDKVFQQSEKIAEKIRWPEI